MTENQGYILIVDSDDYITELLAVNLREEGFEVGIYCNAADVPDDVYDETRLIIVDAMNQQPLNGIAFTQKIKSNPETAHIPVILCTMADGEDIIVDAFDAGVDDYIVKPFSLRELVARVRAVLRRHPLVPHAHTHKSNTTTLTLGTLTIDPDLRRVTSGDEVIPLTRTEFAILMVLLKNRNTYFNRTTIRQMVWKDETMSNDRIVDTNISRLRKKLGDNGEYIINRYGLGYAIVDK